MSAAKNPGSLVLLSYLALLDRIYGMYIDACMGFELNENRMGSMVSPDQHPRRLFLGDFNDPNEPDAKYKHGTTIGHFILRNRRDGENQLLLSQSSIVFVYSIWDSLCRPQLCAALRKEQEEVRCDVMGDLRLYRNAIVHNNFVLQKPTRRLTFIAVGNVVALTQLQMNTLFSTIFSDLDDLNFNLTGERLGIPFNRQLNSPRSP